MRCLSEPIKACMKVHVRGWTPERNAHSPSVEADRSQGSSSAHWIREAKNPGQDPDSQTKTPSLGHFISQGRPRKQKAKNVACRTNEPRSDPGTDHVCCDMQQVKHHTRLQEGLGCRLRNNFGHCSWKTRRAYPKTERVQVAVFKKLLVSN